MFRQDGAKHVERTDVRRGLAASVRARGGDEVCKRMPQHDENKYIKSAAHGEAHAESFRGCGQFPIGDDWWLVWFVGMFRTIISPAGDSPKLGDERAGSPFYWGATSAHPPAAAKMAAVPVSAVAKMAAARRDASPYRGRVAWWTAVGRRGRDSEGWLRDQRMVMMNGSPPT